MRNILASSTAPHAAVSAMAARPDSIPPKHATGPDGSGQQAPQPNDSDTSSFRSILGARMQPAGGRKSLFRC